MFSLSLCDSHINNTSHRIFFLISLYNTLPSNKVTVHFVLHALKEVNGKLSLWPNPQGILQKFSINFITFR